MRRIVTSLWIGGLALASLTGTVFGATAQMTALPVDEVAVTFFNSLVFVWIPIIAVLAVIGLVVILIKGVTQAGPVIIGTVFGLALLAGGLPWVNATFRGQMATTLTVVLGK